MSEPITINGIVLNERAIDIIACFQEENNEELNEQQKTLSLLLVEVVQMNVGEDNWTKFAKALADQLDFLKCLQA